MNFTLRPLTINDLGSLMKYADNPKIADNLTNIFPNPYTEESGRWFIKFATSHDPKHIMAIYARPFGSNIGSQKALEKAGFKLEGRFEKTLFKNGRYEDDLIYAMRCETDK